MSYQVYQMAKGKFDFQKVEKPSADGQQYWRIAGLGDSVKNVKFKRIPLCVARGFGFLCAGDYVHQFLMH